MAEFDRYSKFRIDNGIEMVPYIEIPAQPTDYFYEYRRGQTRLDTLSNDYYGNPNYGWLILQANPEFKGFEFSIPDGVELRIPYPLDNAISRYESSVNSWLNEHRD